MAFSTAGMYTRKFTSKLSVMITWASANTCAAPPRSFFISTMPEVGLMLRPPVSNTTPLPTKAKDGASSLPHLKVISRGSRDEALPTAWMAGKPSSSSSPEMTLNLAPWALAIFSAMLANSSGPMSLAGVLTMSRARNEASKRVVSSGSSPSGTINRALGGVCVL